MVVSNLFFSSLVRQCTFGVVLIIAFFHYTDIVSAAGQQKEKDSAVLCQQLTKHQPNADVTYQPGFDVRGNPVAPADLPGSQFQLQDSFDIPLTIDLASRLGLAERKLGTNNDIQIGTLTVKGDQVLYNGKPLNDQQQENLAALCR